MGKFLIGVIMLVLLCLPDFMLAQGRVHVKGYCRKNGTYVRGYTRRAPCSSSSQSSSMMSSTSSAGVGKNSPSRRGLIGQTAESSKQEIDRLDNSQIKVTSGSAFIYQGQKFRLKGVNIYSKEQGNSKQVRNRLTELLSGGVVEMRKITKDANGSVIAQVFLNGEDVAETLIKEGLQNPKY